MQFLSIQYFTALENTLKTIKGMLAFYRLNVIIFLPIFLLIAFINLKILFHN